MTVIAPLNTGIAPAVLRGSNLTRIFELEASQGSRQNVRRLAPFIMTSVGVNVHVGPDGVLGNGIGAHEGSVNTFPANVFSGRARNITNRTSTAQVLRLTDR